MQPVPQILVRHFERCSRVLCTESSALDNLNMSSISTRLIQDVGRVCERYASDFIISWDAVRKQLKPRHIAEPYHAVELFAIRRSGVDHNSFFMSRLRNDSQGGLFCCEHVYRKVLALGIEIVSDEYPGQIPPCGLHTQGPNRRVLAYRSRGPGRNCGLMQPKPLQILRKRNILMAMELAVTGSKGRYQNEQSGTVHICNQQYGGMAAAECFGDAASCERHDG